jgi:hypothetical protein
MFKKLISGVGLFLLCSSISMSQGVKCYPGLDCPEDILSELPRSIPKEPSKNNQSEPSRKKITKLSSLELRNLLKNMTIKQLRTFLFITSSAVIHGDISEKNEIEYLEKLKLLTIKTKDKNNPFVMDVLFTARGFQLYSMVINELGEYSKILQSNKYPKSLYSY